MPRWYVRVNERMGIKTVALERYSVRSRAIVVAVADPRGFRTARRSFVRPDFPGNSTLRREAPGGFESSLTIRPPGALLAALFPRAVQSPLIVALCLQSLVLHHSILRFSTVREITVQCPLAPRADRLAQLSGAPPSGVTLRIVIGSPWLRIVFPPPNIPFRAEHATFVPVQL